MAAAAEDVRLVDSLLARKGMLSRNRICQTVAEEEFDLEFHHLRDLEYAAEENPNGPRLTPQKMFSVRDVAWKAIQVNGPTGGNQALRQQRTVEEKDRSAMKERIEAERAAAAQSLTPTSLWEEICQAAGVGPSSKLSKKDTLSKFGIEWTELDGLGVEPELKPNPINPRFARMKLYTAGDVAKALAKKKAKRIQALEKIRRATRGERMAGNRARSAAAAIMAAGEQ